MQESELDEQPFMMNTSLVQSHDDHLPCPRLFPMHSITMIHEKDVFCPEVHCVVQKQHDYGKTFNLARKVVRCSVETGGEPLVAATVMMTMTMTKTRKILTQPKLKIQLKNDRKNSL